MNLKDIIYCCVYGRLNRAQRNHLYLRCHSLALSYLRMKAAAGKLFRVQNEDLYDLSRDIIEGLFNENENGKLIELTTFFENKDIRNLTEAEIWIELRIWVFWKVDKNIYQKFLKKDSSYRNIIGKIKQAVSHESIGELITFEDGFLLLNEPFEPGLTLMPPELLELALHSRLDGNMQIPEILNKTVSILREQHRYQKRFPVIRLASIIRDMDGIE